MEYLEADVGEEFTLPAEAEEVAINYIERVDGSMMVRVSYLLRTDGGGSIK